MHLYWYWPGINMSMELLAFQAREVDGRDEASGAGVSMVLMQKTPWVGHSFSASCNFYKYLGLPQGI